ncbi:Heat shock protein 75 kDa, mitochondrial [Acipenser ruthenus]|uniref:Heat shock protein 75 kDa, mitochondrial n=1 Tax=Acipenser ruthenus TaxID=7906 RepID=A0A444UF83_ACIRT|nr:heat shock protein 75 kDa, mitochondrial [Acipenser ruthenus]RXM33748.1 Heat shock protein 75 kDa, mitochondrial [Acipenser ruthenus]
MSRYLSLLRLGFGAPRRADLRHLLSPGWGPGSRRIVAAFSSASYSAGVNQSIGVSLTGAWRPELSRSSAFVARQAYSTQSAETKEEEPLHTIISDTENIEGSFSKHEFQAETKKLLDIVARSLYSEKEVFIRELVSNGCDALEKLRHRLLSAGGESEPMEIHLQTDAEKGTFTIQDTGIGMSKEDLVSNLGTIARSGSKAFLEALQSQSDASSKIIGQFGVGFYSAFMVADRVEVYSQSAEPGSVGNKWSSDGSGVFEIAEASGVRTGTKIVLYLKDDCKEFASEDRVKGVVSKYSNFVSFPVFLNGRRLNTLQALWTMDPKEISEWQHEEFYRYVAQAYDKPRYTLHYRTDAPLNIRSIFYVPEMKPSMFDVSREMGSSVALYSRKVLIQTKATDILPKWLRFLRGVVDSEDIPLNLSRELLQESALIRKLSDVLQKRIIKFLVDQSRKEPEKYAKFFEDYGLFIREGVVTTAEQDVKEDIGKLLRFESSALPAGQTTSLQEYSSRMKAGTRNIHYLCAPNRHLAEHSPYYEAMRKKDMEVLFCFEQFDELTLLHLREFDKKKLISVETDIVVDHYKEEKYEDSKPESERLSQQQAEDLMAWMRNALGSRVTNIKVTPRLDTHPAMITVLEMGAARHFLRTQQLAKTSEERAQILQPTLEINAGHDLIKKLNELKDSDMELAQLLLDQIYDNAMIAAGLNDDPRPMVGRLNELLTKALQKH